MTKENGIKSKSAEYIEADGGLSPASGHRSKKGKTRGWLARFLGAALAVTMGVGIAAVASPGSVKETEVYAKEIGAKNESQKQGCDNVTNGKVPEYNGEEYEEVIDGAVFSGGNSYSQSGAVSGQGSIVHDQDVTDFANPLPYGNTFVDTNKLNWNTPSNFIIDIRDDRFKWVTIGEDQLEDALGNTSTDDPMKLKTPKPLKLKASATKPIRGIFYVGPLESYHTDIKAPADNKGYTNVIEPENGDPYLYRITYLNAVTLPNGTRGNLVLTMTKVQIETPVTVNEENPFTPDGADYSYTKAIMLVQKENELGNDTGYQYEDADGNPLNQQNSVILTEAEAKERLDEINKYYNGSAKLPETWAVEKTIRNAMGNLLDLDIEVTDAEGNPVNGTISYAAHDMDFESVQNVWGRTLGDEFSEGLKIVSGSQSYALVPNYNHLDATTHADGWLPVGPGKDPLKRALSITKEGDGSFADGVRFGSPFIGNYRDAEGTFKDAVYSNTALVSYQGDGLTANNNIIVIKPNSGAGNNSISNNIIKKQLYAMLKEKGYTGVTRYQDVTPEMAWNVLGSNYWKTYRNDNEQSFDSGFAVLLDAKKSSIQWSGSRGTGSNLHTTLFDSSIYTYVEPTHGAGGGIYIESYDISKECATKMIEGSTVMGRNSEVTITAVPEEGYRVGRVLIGDTNYGLDPGERGLQNYTTYTIDGNNIVVDGQVVGTFDGADINVRGHEGLKAGKVELDGFNYDRTGTRQDDPAKKIIIERNADGTVDVTLPDIDNPMHVHADFDTYYNFYKVWKDDSEPEALTMAAAPAGVYPVSVTIPMPTGEYDEVVDENGGKTFVARMEMVDFEINGSTYHALSGENAGVDFVLSPNNTVEYVEYETDQGTGEVTEKFAIRSNVILMGNEFVHYGLDADGNLVIDARYPVTSDTSVADWDSDDAEEFVINASKYEDKYEGYVTELDKNNTISPGNKVWVVKYPSEGKDFDGDGNLDWPALPVEMLPKDADGNIIDNHEAATHTDRYYWFVTEEVPAWSTESYSNEKAKNPGVIHDPDYYKDSAWVAASLKDADIANELIHEDNEYSYAYMSVFENGGEITNEPSIVIRGKKDWQSDFDNKYETREDIWLHLDVKITNPDGSTIERKDMLPPQMVSATATGAQLAKHWGTKASYSTGDKNVRIVASANKLPGNAKLQAVEGKKVYTGPYKYTRKGTTTYYYINELKEKDADGKIYEYSIRETLDWEGNQPVVKDNIDAGLLGYKSEDVADWTEISANEDTYKYKYTYYNAQTGKNENRTTDMKRYTGTVENKYELIDFTVTKKWIDNKDDADHIADEIKNAVTLYDTDGAVDLDAMGQYTTTVKTNDGEKEEALGTLEATPETGKEFTLTWKHLPKYIRDASGKIVYAGYYVTENNTFSGYTAPMYTNVDEPGTPDVDESTDDAKAFNTGVIVNAQLININVKKVWDDADNQDGKRADIKVTLFRNGAEYEQVTLTEEDAKISKTTVDGDTWTWDVWKDLPYADATGNAYHYTAQETEIPDGYDSKQATQQIVLSDFTDEDGDGTEETLTFKATNKHDPEKISFTITKIWDDADNNDGLRPADGEVTYTIKADDTALTAAELAAATITGGNVDGAAVKAKTTGNDGATVTVENLPRYKKAGDEITYTIEETAVDGYDTDVAGDYTAGFTVTNKHVPEVGSIKVTKIWDDANDQDGKRAATTVTLYQTVDRTTKTTAKVEDATVTLDGGLAKVDGAASNEYTWTDLPVYEAGKKIIYSVEEAAVAEYDTTYDGNDIGLKKNEISEIKVTNKYTPETTDVTIKKVWDDENDKWGKRPAQADWVKSLTLTDDDEAYDSSKVTPTVTGEQKDNEWTVTWSGLQKNKTKTDVAADVAQIKYDVTEDTSKLPDGYTADPAEGKAGDGGTITNKLTLYTITFVDPNPEDPDSPVTITEKKYPKGEQPEDPTDTDDPDEDGTWTEDYPAYEFDGWDETVDPVTGDKTYTAKYVRNIPVEKVWDDNDDQDGKRPDEINVKLLADGQDTDKRVKLSDNTNWKGTFTQLPWKTNNNMPDGDIIQYTVAEDSIDGYTAVVSGDAENGFVITNTHDPEKTDVYVEKEWNDSNNQDGIRPDSVVFKLAEVIDSKTGETKDLGQSAELSESTGWTAVFEGLVKNRDGSPIMYTVIEAMQDALEKIGYNAGDVSGKGTKDEPYTITNTREAEKVTIKATKVWDDMDDKYGLRKDAVFTLLADGTAVSGSEKTIAKDATGDALTVEWEVDKYRNGGTEISYTVTEADVRPYSQAVTGDMVSGFVITNTYPPVTETTEVTRTIIYTYLTEDGVEASKTVTQTVTLSRVPTVINEAGGVVEWSDWEIVDGDTSPVDTPVIDGWTPDRTAVDKWQIEYDENGRPKNAEEHVVYQPDAPVGTPDETYGGKGESQTGTPEFEVTTPTTPDGKPNEIVEVKLIDPQTGEPTDAKSVSVPEGTYTLNDDGTITFTPNDTEYVGDPTPVDVRGTDKNGLTADTTYTPHVVDNTDTVKRTITYEYSNGDPVLDDDGEPLKVEEEVTFTGTVDPKTGKVTYPDEEKEKSFPETDSPDKDGWTPDTDPVNEDKVHPGDDDIVRKVIYNPSDLTATPDETYGLKGEQQTGEPKFEMLTPTASDGTPNEIVERKLIDPSTGDPDDDGSVTIPGQGTYTLNDDGTITFTPEPDFVGNPTPIGVTGTDKNGMTAKTTYTPHVVDREDTGEATRTIHYTYLTEDGVEVTDDTVQTATLVRHATEIDPKSGEVKNWGPWEKATLEAVDNPDDEAGYGWSTTDEVGELDVTEPGDKGIEYVVYKPQPPVAEKDETWGLKDQPQTGTPIFSVDTEKTPEGEDNVFVSIELLDENGDPAEKVTVPEGTYELEKDADGKPTGNIIFTPNEGFVGDPTPVNVQATDKLGGTAKTTYKPHVVDSEDKGEATRTIHYTYLTEDGTVVTGDVTQSVELTRKAKSINPETGEVEWDDWSTDELDPEPNPDDEAGEGWSTTDKVDKLEVTEPGDKGTEYVVYHPEKPVGTPDETYGAKNQPQKGEPDFEVTTKKMPDGSDNEIVEVKLIDPQTGEPTDAKEVSVPEGTYKLNDDGTVTFTPNEGFVGDPTPVKLQGTDKLGGTDETTYTPHVVDATETEEVTRTIEYEYSDGTKVVDKDGKPIVKEETLKFTRTGTVDPKTGEVTYKDEDWKPETTDKFDKVTSPTEENPGDATNLKDWTPDRNVDEKTVKATDDDIYEKVIYNPKGVEATPDETWGLKGEPQTGKPDFKPETEFLPDGTKNEIVERKLIDPQTGDPVDEVKIPGQGTYKMNPDGTVTFTPEPDFVGNPSPVGVVGTDKLGNTAKTTYTPHVVDPEEKDKATRTIHYTYLTQDGEEVTEDTKQSVELTRKAAKIDPKTGEVTEWGDWEKATLPAVDNPDDKATKDGKSWTTTDKVEALEVTEPGDKGIEYVVYLPEDVPPVKPPVGSDKETYGLKGDPQSDTPEFTPGTGKIPEKGAYSLEDPDADDPLKKTIPGEGTYVLDPDTGKVTFTPEPDFVGDGTGVTVKVTDENGLTATGKYTPHVVDPYEKGEATRTIHYTYLTKDGEKVTEDTIQSAMLIRGAKAVDPKTGEVTEWGDWSTGELPAVTNPDDKATRDGKYWTTDDKVDKLEVTEPGDKGTEYVVYTYETMDITAKKVWDDNDDQDGKRPNNVVFNLVADGIATKLSEILNKDNGWTATFTALDKYKSGGTEIIYTVVEALKDDLERAGYTADESEADKDGGYTITNKYTPEQVTIKATKVWDDQDDKYGLRKDVTFTLMADGTAVADSAQTIAKDATGDALTVEWTVDKYRNGGTEINYTVTESNVSPYSQAVTGDAENGFIITNTYPPVTETTEVTRTIIYTYLTEDGKEASETVTQTVKLQRVPTVIDEAGGVVEWSDWEILEGDTDEVTSPEIEGWTPDRATVEEWDIEYDDDGRPMNATEHVVYQPQPPVGTPDETYGGKGESQTGTPEFEVTTPTTPDGSKNEIVKIELLDEDGNPTDKVEVPEGTYTLNDNGTITFTPNDPEYVGDPTPVNVRGTDKNGLTDDTTYTPHIVDNVETEEVTRTIEYEYYDGTKVVDENGDPITKTETLKFTRTGTVDPKTGEITYKDEDWKADTTDTFDEVVSPTEDEPGDATNLKDYVPDRDSVDSKTVKATDDDIYEKVIYNHKDLIPTPDETYGLKNQPQTGEPKFDPENDTTPGGDPNVIEDRKLIDPSTGEPTDEPVKIEGQGTYTLNEDGTITFTPEEDFVGNPTPIGVIGTDTIGNKAKTTYTPHVVDPEEKGTATRTIHYTYLTKDGEEVTEDTKQSVELTHKAAKIDPKTGKVTEWGAWSKETLPAVDNPDDKATKDGKAWTTTDKVEELEVTEPGDKGVVNVVYQTAPLPPEEKEETTTVTRKIEYKYYDEDGNEASVTITQTAELKRTAKTINPDTGEVTEWNDWEIVDDKDNKAVDSPEIEGWNPDRKNVPPMDIDLTKDDPQEGIKDELVVYTPEPPVGTPKKTYGKIGKPQSTDAKKLFEVTTPTTDTGEPNEIVKIELIDPETGEPAKTSVDPETGKTVYGPIPAYGINPETGEREQVGTYELDPETGIVTFKPNETFTGTPEPATLKATDKNGLDTTTTYTPNIPDKRQKVTVDREITYMYKKADGTEAPVLDEKGDPVKVVQTVTFVRETNVDPETGALTWTDWEPEEAVMGKVVSPTEDKTEAASGQKATDLEGWTPDKDVDEFKVTIDPETEQPFEPADDVVYYICEPKGSDKETWGAPGEQQKGTPKFTEGTGKITKYELTDPDPDDPNKKTVPGEGTYVLNPETGEITFTPEDGFTGKGTGVTVKATDENGKTAEGKYNPNVPEPETQTGKRTITYLYDDGTPVLDENGNPIVEEQIEEFTRTPKKVDPETGEVTEWNEWDKKDYPEKDSPEVDGYTPNKDKVDEDSAKPGDNKEEIVIYKKTSTDPTRETETETVKRVIHYRYLTRDGKIADEDVEQTVTFTREKITSPDGEVTYTEWKAVAGDKDFAEVASPVKDGYDADRDKVDAVSVTPDSEDMEEWVIYTPVKTPDIEPPEGTEEETWGKKGEPQSSTAEFKFTEGTGKITGYTLKDPDDDNPNKKTVPGEGVYELDPETGKVTFTPESDFVGKGTGVTVIATDENGLTAEGKYTPNIAENVDVKKVKRIVEHVYSNGTPVLDDDGKPVVTEQEVTFTREGTVDPETGEVTYPDWTEVKTLDEVPALEKLLDTHRATPDKVGKMDVTGNSGDLKGKIVYTPIAPHTVTYVDNHTGEVIKVDPEVPHHGSSVVPNPPDHDGYEFKGWRKPDGTIVTDLTVEDVITDLVFEAVYEPSDSVGKDWTVTYVDSYTGDVIKVDKPVADGGSSVVPTPPEHDNCVFKGWQKPDGTVVTELTVEDVHSNLVFTALYDKVYDEHVVVSRVIHYRYLDKDGKEVTDDHVDSVMFSRKAIVDGLTGESTWTEWEPKFHTFDPVDSPEKEGWTPDQTQIPEQTVYPDGTNEELWVIYTPEEKTEEMEVSRTIYYTYYTEDGEEASATIVQKKKLARKLTMDPETGEWIPGDWYVEEDYVKAGIPDIPGFVPNMDEIPPFEVDLKDPKDSEPVHVVYVDSYWVTYVDPDGVTVYLEKTTQAKGEPEPKSPADPVKDGFVFGGWSREVDDKGNVTYTAIWTPEGEPVPETYWVTYVDPDGVTVYLAKTTQKKGEPEPEAPADPRKDGFVFGGWSREVDDKGNVTYTAIWTPEGKDPTYPEKPTDPADPTQPADPTKPGGSKVTPGAPSQGGRSVVSGPGGTAVTSAKAASPGTGDRNNILIWVVAAIAAAGAGITAVVVRRRKKGE